MPKKIKDAPAPVKWLSEKTAWENSYDPSFKYKAVDFYTKFKYKHITAALGDFVLISNADAAEPDSEEGCEPAQLVTLYESYDETLADRHRARVLWFSRPSDLPPSCFNNNDLHDFAEQEVIEDHRPFDVDVSIETFFKQCHIIKSYTTQEVENILADIDTKQLTYVCRYRLTAITKKKFLIEPVMDDERKREELLKTPISKGKKTPQFKTKTPNSLVKRMNQVSISEQNKWSISNTEGTKLLLKRAILADNLNKNERKSLTSLKTKNKLAKSDINDLLSMDVECLSDSDSISSMNTAKRSLFRNDDENMKPSTPRRISYFRDSSGKEEDTSMRRTPRSVKKHVKYEEISPVKTPTKLTQSGRRKKAHSESEEEFVVDKKVSTTGTPKRKSAVYSKRVITSQLTPTLQPRSSAVKKLDDLPEDNSLPGREQQLEEILSFVKAKLIDCTSGCMYISGVPGTGKTATVCAALDKLKTESNLPNFQLLEVNGMRIAEPRQAYVQIYKQLTGKSVAWEQACSLLEKRFTNPAPRRTPTVLLVDELDALCTRRQDVLYSIVEWASHMSARLAVLTIANTMDLPERVLAARVASRLGLTRLSFPPYSFTQLERIVVVRLGRGAVTADAAQLIARKVAAVSGDARRALALCARATELARPEPAGLSHVTAALGEAAGGAAVRAIKSCAPAEQLLLRALASEVERTGSDETTLSRILQAASALAALEGPAYRGATSSRAPSTEQALRLCSRLASTRLLLLEPRAGEMRLLLNVSTDDVHYATRQL